MADAVRVWYDRSEGYFCLYSESALPVMDETSKSGKKLTASSSVPRTTNSGLAPSQLGLVASSPISPLLKHKLSFPDHPVARPLRVQTAVLISRGHLQAVIADCRAKSAGLG